LAGSGPLADAEQDKPLVLAGGAAACWPDPAVRVGLALGAGLAGPAGRAGAALWCGCGRGAGFRACRAWYSARLCDAGRALAAFAAFAALAAWTG
jgi:hypothetical protein